MKWFFANKTLVTLTAFVAFGVGIWASSESHDSMWFARSGAVAVAMGIFLMTNGQLNGIQIHDVWDESSQFKLDDPKHYDAIGEDVPDWVWQHRSVRMAIEMLGPVVTLTGTIVWGFGDLIPF